MDPVSISPGGGELPEMDSCLSVSMDPVSSSPGQVVNCWRLTVVCL